MPVRDPEEAEGADEQMDVESADVRAEYPGGASPLQDLLDGRYGADVDATDGRELLQVLRVVDVLHRDQTNEAGMALVVLEGDLHEAPQRLERRQLLEMGLALPGPDAVVSLLENRAIQPILAAEIIVDHPFRGARTLRDRIDSCAGEPILGEFVHGHRHDIRLGSLGVGEILQLLAFCRCALLGGHAFSILSKERTTAPRSGCTPRAIIRYRGRDR